MPSDPTGENYLGHLKISASGNSCKRWGKRHREFKNFCRKLVKRDRPGCWVREGGKLRFEYCDVPRCTSDDRLIIPTATSKLLEEPVVLADPAVLEQPCSVNHTGPFDVCGQSCVQFSPTGIQAPFSRHRGDGGIVDHVLHSRKRRQSDYDYASYSEYSVNSLKLLFF